MFSATPAAWLWGALAACRVANDGGSRCSDAASQRLFSRRRHSRATIHHQRAREQALFARMSKFACGLRVHEWACRACRGALLCYWTAYSRPASSSRCDRGTQDPHTCCRLIPSAVSCDVPELVGYRCKERRAEHSEAIYVAIGQPTVTSARARGAKDAP